VGIFFGEKLATYPMWAFFGVKIGFGFVTYPKF
jgi:hypothetical protein